MFKKFKGGEIERICDRFDCWIPPVGMGINTLTGELEQTDIIKRSLKKSEQYWERQPLPAWWKDKRKAERRKQEMDRDYIDQDCETYRQMDWGRRLRGVWVYINGKPVYITGTHYFYLNWWKFQGKFLDYRDPNRKFFYVWDYCVEDPNCLGLIEITKRKEGKCFGVNTPIRMYDGSTKMVQDISDGEMVMGNDSTPRLVSGTTSGKERMYRIAANKGESFTCNESHILALMWNGIDKPNYKGWSKGDKVNISVKEYLSLKEWEKDHLVMYRSGWGSHYVEVAHSIPSYMLGVYLGDGSNSCGSITGIDKEIIDYVGEFAETMDLKLSVTEKITYRLAQKGAIKTEGGGTHLKNWKRNPYKEGLRKINVLNNKHIPSEYLIDSESNRLELLAGIIDTDGYLEKAGEHPKKYEIIQKNERLANDICELARSLGFFVSKFEKTATMVRADGTIYKVKAYRMSIFGDISRIPCKVERKKAIKVERRKDSLNFGFKVEPLGEGDYYGFSVDENHLFLLADGTVVHNTARAGCILYEYISRTPSKHGGIQSKTDPDAKEVFDKAVIHPWQKLPDFYRPVYDTGKSDSPSEMLKFFRPSVRGKQALDDDRTDEALESFIDFMPRGVDAYDGPELHRYVSDEAGKLKDVSIRDRHNTVMMCSEVDGEYVGKQLYTTTVEEMTSGGGEFLKLVNDSNFNERNANGRTKTGLYVYFLSAFETMYYDRYGMPDKARGMQFYMNSREAMKNDEHNLQSFIRKNPFTLDECFSTDSDNCLYNAYKLTEREKLLRWNTESSQFGNFIWKDGIKDSEVLWEPSLTGRWEVSWLPELKDRNRVQKEGNLFYPRNIHQFISGSDTYDHNSTEDVRNSKAASFVKRRMNPLGEDHTTRKYVVKYHARPPMAEMVYEDLIMQCFFFGCQILCESNKPGVLNYFDRRGYRNFLVHIPGYKEPGIPSTQDNKREASLMVESYIEQNIDKMDFIMQISQLLGFDIKKTEKYDLVMAMLWTEYADNYRYFEREEEKEELMEVDQFMRTY